MNGTNIRPRGGDVEIGVRRRPQRDILSMATCGDTRWEAEIRVFDEYNEHEKFRASTTGDEVIGEWRLRGTTRGHATRDAALQAAHSLAQRRHLQVTTRRMLSWGDRWVVRDDFYSCLACGAECGSRCSLHPSAGTRVIPTYQARSVRP